MDERLIGLPTSTRCVIDDIPLRDIDRDLLRHDHQLFMIWWRPWIARGR